MMRFPKHQYIRSPALMKAYRQIPCQHCGAEDGTVCGAHSNQSADGKGRSIKADDNKCASLCFRCHAALDQGSFMARAEREAIKAVDVAGAYACTACDAAYDQMQGVKQAGLTREQVDLDWFHGHMRSLVILVKKGLVK